MTGLAALIDAAGFADDTPVAVAAAGPDGRIEAAASGTWRNGRPVTLDDQFYAASLAKQVTGAAAALLVREKRLDPDAPVARSLDDLPGWAETITPRQLAHHIAGLPAAGVAEATVAGDWSEAAVSAYLVALPELPYAPGEAYHYSNLGYVLLARLVATVSGMPLAQFAEQRLFGWPGIGFATDIGSFAQADYLGPSRPLTHGDGGLWTTAPAFARWLGAQNRDALGIAELVEAPGKLNDGATSNYGWGLGLRQYRSERLLIHGGNWPGASAKAMRCPTLGLAVVALAATDDMPAVLRLADAMLELAAETGL